jgi:tripeptide aminopeptidase
MINANALAAEFAKMLPEDETPETTEGYQGFYHLLGITSNIEQAKLSYIIRDHDRDKFEDRKRFIQRCAEQMNEKYGAGTAKLTIREQYRNMAEPLHAHMEIVELARKAVRRLGLEPVCVPVRGGTDGSQLSFRGLLCPNLGTGGYACHGPFEHVCVEEMDQCVQVALNLVKAYAN